jgi:hypothetical protein
VRRTRPVAAPSRVPLVTRRALVCARARASVCIECSSRGAGEYRIRVLGSYRNPSLCSILACWSVSNARVVAPGRVCGLRCDSTEGSCAREGVSAVFARVRACVEARSRGTEHALRPRLPRHGSLGSLVTAPSAPLSPWLHGSMAPWLMAPLALRPRLLPPWLLPPSTRHGSLPRLLRTAESTAPRLHGSMAPWLHGSMAPPHGSSARLDGSSARLSPRLHGSLGAESMAPSAPRLSLEWRVWAGPRRPALCAASRR